MQPANLAQPVFEPTYLNMEYVFDQAATKIGPFLDFITDGKTWENIGYISIFISILSLFIIIFSLVRMFEIQELDKEEIEHEINHALAKRKEEERDLNPRWKYILVLVESPNESDWRVAILESDTMLEEALKERGLVGNSMAELLEEAKANGYQNLESAWGAHIVRNKIAHEGQNFPISQVEARRVLKLYENVFEGLKLI